MNCKFVPHPNGGFICQQCGDTSDQRVDQECMIDRQGPGTELKSLLSLVGITALENCKCNKYAAEMNNRGIDWCQDNVATIVSWLEAEAKSRRLPFSAAAAKLIVKLSIRRAKKKG
jgi:hypothetical protein